MDFRVVCQTFNGTFFYEEFRSDPNDVYSSLNKYESFALRSLDENGGLLLLKALQASLRGNIARSNEFLSELLDNYGINTRWHRRAKLYMLLNHSWQNHPPIFRFASIKSGPSITFHNILHDIDAEREKLIAACAVQQDQITDIDILETEVILAIEVISRRTLESARQLNPKYCHYVSDEASRSRGKAEVNEILDHLEELAGKAFSFDLAAISCYMDRLRIEIILATGNDVRDLISDLEQRYRESNDTSGLASILMLKGDTLSSSPFTSVLVLNLNLVDYWSGTSFNSDCDDSAIGCVLPPWGTKMPDGPVAFNSIAPGAARAEDCYTRAMELYGKSLSMGGVSMALLKRAGLHNCVSRRFELAVGKGSSFTFISQTLDTALDSSQSISDEMQHHLAIAHKLSFQVDTRKHPERCAKISQWTESRQNGIFGLYLSLFLRRNGDYYRYMPCYRFQSQYLLAGDILHSTVMSPALLQAFDSNLESQIECGDFRYHRRLVDTCMGSLATMKEQVNNARLDDLPRNGCLAIHQYFLRRFMSLILLHWSATGAPYGWKEMMEPFFEQLDIDDEDPLQVHWLSQISSDMDFLLARSTMLEWLQTGDSVNALQVCDGYLAEQSSAPSVPDSLYQADLLLLANKKERAREKLVGINLDILADGGPVPTLQGSLISQENLRYKMFLARESLLSRCIKAEAWDLAKTLIRSLQIQQPAYFNGPGRWSLAPPYQRYLWLGLLKEADGNLPGARESFDKGLDCLSKDLNLQAEIEQRKGMVDEPEAQRLLHSFVRVSLLESFDGENRTVSKKIALDAIARFEMFKMLPLVMQIERLKSMTPADLELWSSSEYMLRRIFELNYLSANRNEQEETELAQLKQKENEAIMELGRLNLSHQKIFQLKEHSSTDLLGAIPMGCVVVYLAISETGTSSFVLAKNGLYKGGWSSRFTTHSIRIAMRTLNGMLAEWKDDIDHKHMDPWLEILRELVVEGAMDIFSSPHVNHIIFIPSGDFGLCPLGLIFHGLSDKGVNKPIYQVPSLSVLLMMQRNIPLGNDSLENKDDSTEAELKVSAIAKVGSDSEAIRTGEPMLAMAGIEALMIAKSTSSKALNGKGMKREQFLQAFRSSDIIHVCTHGYIDNISPLRSYLSLKEKLRLTDLLAARSQAMLVVFSACFSGIGKSTYGEDLTGFSHAILATGARAFIGSLWAVDDLATLFLMHFFYESMPRSRGKTIAQLWYAATTKLRDLKFEDARTTLDEFLVAWDGLERDGKDPKKIIKSGRKYIIRAKENLGEYKKPGSDCPFSHPYFWAPFILVGDGSQVVFPF